MSSLSTVIGRWHGALLALLLICLSAGLIAFALPVRAQSSLPPTSLGRDTGTDWNSLRIPPGFARAAVASNPGAPDARVVGESMCVSCHTLENRNFSHTVHALGLRAAAKLDPSLPVCESCHGAGSAHAAAPTMRGLIIGFTRNSGTPVAVQAGACLGCHSGGPRNLWQGSVHQRLNVSCSDCHNPMARVSAEGLQARQSISETCATCHRDVRQEFNKRSHMPRPEGQMTCADCHHPHGSTAPALLKADTVNETCHQCHAEKRGPFLFEHPPVRDNCLNCHKPHGSNNNTLLVAPTPFLCQQCHTSTRHPNDLQTPASIGTGLHPDERVMGRGCITCHAQVHGSNNPSGPRFHK